MTYWNLTSMYNAKTKKVKIEFTVKKPIEADIVDNFLHFLLKILEEWRKEKNES